MSDKELKIVRKVKIKIVLLFIEDKRKQQLSENKESEDSTFSISKSKNPRKKKQKKKNNKIFKESSKSELSVEKQLLLRLSARKLLFSLNIRLFSATISRSRVLTIETARFFLQVVAEFIFADRDNNTKVCEYIEISIDLRYKINYCSIISAKIQQIVDLIIFEKSQKTDYKILFLKSVLYLVH